MKEDLELILSNCFSYERLFVFVWNTKDLHGTFISKFK